MTAAPIAFRSSPGRYSYSGTARVFNGHAEKQGEDAKATLAVLPCDGLVLFVDTEAGPCRGLIYLEDLEVAYSIHQNAAYRINFDGTTATATRIGTVPGSDPCQLSRNQKADPQVVVRCDAGVLVIEGDTVAFILDEDLPPDVVSAEYAAGYHAYLERNRKWTISGLNSAKVIDPTDFATFEQKAGQAVRLKEHAGELLGFCSSWFEIWRAVNDVDFPFSPLGTKPRGLLAAGSIVDCDNTLFFVGNDGNVHRLDNYNPVVVSTPEVARLVQGDAAQADILGFGWEQGGHAFASFTGTNWTRCYDASTGFWHNRESYGNTTWRARHIMPAWGRRISGDRLSGKLFTLTPDVFTEDGGPLIWGVDSPVLHVFPDAALVDAVHFDLATGYGTMTGQGVDPKIMISVSKDGGNTWGTIRELSLGARGSYATRVTARNFGQVGPKGIVFRIRISDPVVRSLIASDVDLRPLSKR